MFLLSACPDCVCMDIMSLWCERKELAKLDSAVCNENERVWLLDIFKNEVVVFSQPLCFDRHLENGENNDEKAFGWVEQRGIKVGNLRLGSGFDFGRGVLIDTSMLTVLAINYHVIHKEFSVEEG